jgi:acetyl-CoA carboxylase beta subunit
MSTAAAGATRECPHCRATILQSAAVCPQCRHHLRFDERPRARAAGVTALAVEGSFRQPAGQAVAEYSVVVAIRDERGKELARQVIGVGSLQPGELRSFSLAVEVSAPS